MIIKRAGDGSETWNNKSNCISAEIKYFALGLISKNDAIEAVFDDKPEKFGGLPCQGVRFDGVDTDGNATLTVLYGTNGTGNSNVGDDNSEATMSFDCSGGTKHINYAEDQRCVSGSLNAGIAVGWNGKTGGDMEISGVDVPTGQMRETYIKSLSTSKLSTSYKRQLGGMVGKINANPFKGWEPGEVMFLGASFSAPINGASRVIVTYNFGIQQNEDHALLNGIYIGNKRGYEYVWAISSTSIYGSKVTLSVTGIYIATVCKSSDFSRLGV